jgi:hypothetical protein
VSCSPRVTQKRLEKQNSLLTPQHVTLVGMNAFKQSDAEWFILWAYCTLQGALEFQGAVIPPAD